MRKALLLMFLSVTAFATSAVTEEVIRIEIGKDYNRYSESDLRRRVWELERAVFQLQQKVFQIEMGQGGVGAADQWLCKIKAMGDVYTGTAPSKAVATQRAIEACKAGRGGDGFFCKDASCEK